MTAGAPGNVAQYTAARYVAGAIPQNQVMAVGGGQVLLEASVDARGNVVATRSLRTTPPFTEPVRAAVQQWTFDPAMDNVQTPVGSTVLVAAVFRPPTIDTPTLGEGSRDVAPASDEVPFPTTVVTPLFPPRAMFDGVVMVEVLVGTEGRVTESRVVRSAPPFDGAALDAVNQWRFRPARVKGAPAAVYAYVVFGFRQPVTTTR